jgi:type IV pilus assembly protein PilQ
MRFFRFCILVLICLNGYVVSGQNTDPRVIEVTLNEYAIDHPKLERKVDISFAGGIQDFILAFCKETEVNVSLSPEITQNLTVNFSDVSPKDILLYLVATYKYDLKVFGDIISLDLPKKTESAVATKQISLIYNAYSDQLTYDLRVDTLGLVLGELSRASGKNIIAKPEVTNNIITAHAVQSKLEAGLDILAIQNNLTYKKDDRGFYVFAKADDEILTKVNQQINAESQVYANPNFGGQNQQQSRSVALDRDTVTQEERVVVHAIDADLFETVRSIMQLKNKQFTLLGKNNGVLSFHGADRDINRLLNNLLLGTGLSFSQVGEVYVFDDEKSAVLTRSRLYQFRRRSVVGVAAMVPKEILREAQVLEMVELNSIMVTGNETAIARVTEVFDDLDKSVPVINIELLIVDVKKTYSVSTGLELGMDPKPVQAQGQLYPSIDFTFSDKGINNLLGLLAGNGIINIGKVKPGFYASLQAVEDNGVAKVQSKPLLSTLNGKEAVFSLGEKRYFQIQRTTLQGNQSPISLQDRTFESVNADFSIKILPVVSGDENVTLSIQVDQSDFIGPIQSDAPPPQISRVFNSNIRVKNGEMIVLGGLERKSKENNGRGLPLLSRIPVIKWLFSSRNATKDSSKLLLFVKPTIYY